MVKELGIAVTNVPFLVIPRFPFRDSFVALEIGMTERRK